MLQTSFWPGKLLSEATIFISLGEFGVDQYDKQKQEKEVDIRNRRRLKIFENLSKQKKFRERIYDSPDVIRSLGSFQPD